MYYRHFINAMNTAVSNLCKAASACSHCYKEHKKEYWKTKLHNELTTIVNLRKSYPEHTEKYENSTSPITKENAIILFSQLNKAIRLTTEVTHLRYLRSEVSKLTDAYPELNVLTPEEPKPEEQTPALVAVTAPGVLEAGAKHMRDRAVTYDKPEGERSMEKVVAMFNLLYGHNLTETEGWRFMLLLKLVRSTQRAFKLDNFEDAVAYEALAAEAAAKGK